METLENYKLVDFISSKKMKRYYKIIFHFRIIRTLKVIWQPTIYKWYKRKAQLPDTKLKIWVLVELQTIRSNFSHLPENIL
jgi:hypothetical protein